MQEGQKPRTSVRGVVHFKSYCFNPNARNGEAAYKIYHLSRRGEGPALSYSDSMEWSRRAAKAGHPQAMRYWVKEDSMRDGLRAKLALEYARVLLEGAPAAGDADLWDVIAMAYARNRLFKEAIEYQLKAIALAGGNSDQAEKVKEFNNRLSLYRNGKPYPSQEGDGS